MDQFFNLLIATGFVGFALFLMFRFELDNTLLVLISTISIMGTIPLLLTINYLMRSLSSSIYIDQQKELFVVTCNGKTENYSTKDITSMDIFEQRSLGRYGFYFDFVKYTFKNGKSCIATNFMTDQYFIPFNIGPRMSKVVFPIIWKGTNI